MSNIATRKTLLYPQMLAPTNIEGCKLWLDFSDANYLFTDAGTTKVSADAQAIYQVNDKSGNAFHHVQATLAARPLYKTGIKNGRSVARFDGTDDDMATVNPTTVFTNTGSGFVVIVFSPSASTNVSYRGVYVQGTDTGNTLATITVGHLAAGHFEVGGRRLSGDTTAIIDGGVISNGSYYAVGGKFDWANSNLFTYSNGARTNTKTDFQSDGVTSATVAANLSRIGKNVAFFTGDICELVAYSPAPTEADIAKLFAYLSNKWSL